MPTLPKRREAEKFYDAGVGLITEGRYDAALFEITRAADAFRKLDVPGHPFSSPLPNGVSGLANSLYQMGICYQKLGKFEKAIPAFETSLINAKFEKKRPFQSFVRTLSGDLAACYEKELEKIDPQMLTGLLTQVPPVNPEFVFPFSLNPDLIPIARLYELVPERYGHYKDFYERALSWDTEIRYRDKADISQMRKMSLYTWGILLLLWAGYSFTVIKALLHK